MKFLKYFFQFIIIFIFFLICKIIGYKNSSDLGSLVGGFFGPFFRSKKVIDKNLKISFPQITNNEKEIIIKNMWKNYGRILADYMFIENFRKQKLNNYIQLENKEILTKIKSYNKPVVFISGHFNNFELLAMKLEMSGINLSTIYRPLNNIFLNPIMEHIRKNYICKKQVKKGISGTKELLKYFKNGTSIALMIDQRVSEGIYSKFFNKEALTTTIPAQFVKKFKAKIVPIYIERNLEDNFTIEINKCIEFPDNDSIESITLKLNEILEKMILRNPDQWIWTHNRWKN